MLSAKELSIALTSFSGDADLYVSCDSNPDGTRDGTPSQTHYTWQSITLHEDTVTIAADDDKYCGAEGGSIKFYVAVYGFQASQFTLLASSAHEDNIELTDGQPQVGSGAEREMKLFSFHVPAAAQQVRVTVTPTQGDPDLYIALQGKLSQILFRILEYFAYL